MQLDRGYHIGPYAIEDNRGGGGGTQYTWLFGYFHNVFTNGLASAVNMILPIYYMWYNESKRDKEHVYGTDKNMWYIIHTMVAYISIDIRPDGISSWYQSCLCLVSIAFVKEQNILHKSVICAYIFAITVWLTVKSMYYHNRARARARRVGARARERKIASSRHDRIN